MSWNTPNYGSTGYSPNMHANLQDIILRGATDILRSFIGRGTCTEQLASAVYDRCYSSINGLSQDIENKFMDHNGQIDSNNIFNYLSNTVIPTMMRECGNYMVDSRFGNNGFNNYNNYPNNGGWNNPVPSWSQPSYSRVNYGGFSNYGNQQYVAQDSGSVASTMGYGKAIMAQGGYVAQNPTPPIPTPNVDNNPYLPNTNTYNSVPNNTPTVSHKKELSELTEKLSKNFVDRAERRKKNLSVDKLTNNTSSIVDNRDFISSKVSENTVEIISDSKDFTNGKKIEKQSTIVTEYPEYCKCNDSMDISLNGSVININYFDLKVPVANAQEAIELVKEASPEIINQEQWVANIYYKELVAKKLVNYGNEAKHAFRAINENIDKVESLQDLNNIIIPIFKRQIAEVREYMEALVFDRINELFRTNLYHPNHPKMYPSVHNWKGIYDIIETTSDNDYIKYMFNRLGDNYIEQVFICVKSALIDIFEEDIDTGEVIVEPEGDGLGLIAKMSEVTCIAGKYRMCDYGYIPESHKENIIKKFNKDYIVHKLGQNVTVTNIDVDTILGTKANTTVVSSAANLHQLTIQGLVASLKKTRLYKNNILIQVDNSGNICKVYSIGMGSTSDNELIVIR